MVHKVIVENSSLVLILCLYCFYPTSHHWLLLPQPTLAPSCHCLCLSSPLPELLCILPIEVDVGLVFIVFTGHFNAYHNVSYLVNLLVTSLIVSGSQLYSHSPQYIYYVEYTPWLTPITQRTVSMRNHYTNRSVVATTCLAYCLVTQNY